MKRSIIFFATMLFASLLLAQVGINNHNPQKELDVIGEVKISSLASGSTQMVVSDTSGILSTQAIPTSTSYTGGTGISITGPTITNTSPDQTVVLNDSGSTTISGTYPNFTISSTDLVDDADADPSNEIQVLSKQSLTVSLSNGGGSFVDEVDDADADPFNEIQTLSLSGNTLSLSSANTIDFTPILPTVHWSESSGDIFRSSGNVMIGDTSMPSHILHVKSPTSNDIFRLEGSGVWGSKARINFGDADYVYIEEDEDDDLTIYASDDIALMSGFVGVGKDNPSVQLDVNGDIKVSSNANVFGMAKLYGTNTLQLSGDAIGGADLILGTNGSSGFGHYYTNVALNIRNFSGNAGAIFTAQRNNGTFVFVVEDTAGVKVLDDLLVTGNLQVNGTKNFILDHPQDPANKSLVHNAVEGPGYITYYHGTTTLDASGTAEVQLPAYFEALNGEIHYQLTCVGGFAQVYIAEEVSSNQFKIAGGTPGLKVSWQITAERHDPWAKDHPYQAEQIKKASQQGKYWYPEGYGQPNSKRIGLEETPIVGKE